MQLDFPEEELISLITSLEADTCPIPASESARLSMVSPREACRACNRGVELRKSGDLVGANEAFIEMLHSQDSINSTALWAWARVMLLAKDFRHAQLLLHAEFANRYRGTQLFNPFVWMNFRLNLPGFEISWLYDGSVPNYEVHAVNYFDDPEVIEEGIRNLGNNGCWSASYTWAPEDYAEFIRYFSPISCLAYDNGLYSWTTDDPEAMKSLYDEAYARMVSGRGEMTDGPGRRVPTAPTFRYFEGVSSVYDLNITYVRDTISADYYDFSVSQDTLNDLSNTIDLAKQDAMFALGGDDSYAGMLRNCRMIAMGRLRDVRADPKEQEFTVQVMRDYFLMRAIHFSVEQLRTAIALGGEAKYACYYEGTRSIPIIEACLIGVPDMVADLIAAGADVNSTKMNGESALATAVSYDHYDVVRILLDRGADPNIGARRGLAPLSQAQNARMVNLLVERGADPNIPDQDGDLPIIPLICSGYKEGAIALYKAGTDMDHKNRKGETARDYYRHYYHSDLA